MRHSYVTHLRAARIDDADLAEIAGHTVQTMIGHYAHALGRSVTRPRDSDSWTRITPPRSPRQS